MSYDHGERRRIYDRTDGRCHLCREELAYRNYAAVGARGAWEVDHSRARARGGSDCAANLFPACISCNREKGASSSRTMRAQHGFSRAPMSRDEQSATRVRNAAITGIGALFIGMAPPVALGVAALAALLDPED